MAEDPNFDYQAQEYGGCGGFAPPQIPTQPPPPDDLAPATAAQIKAMLQAMVGDPLIHILTMLEKLDNKTERLGHRVDGHDLDLREIKYEHRELVRRVEALERGPSNGSASG